MVIVELIKFYIRGTLSDYIIVPMGEEVDSIFRVIDLVNNRDGMDHLIEIEEVVFDNEVFNIYDLLELKEKNFPDEFVLNHPYQILLTQLLTSLSACPIQKKF